VPSGADLAACANFNPTQLKNFVVAARCVPDFVTGGELRDLFDVL
jgi:hypothetical protein